MAEVADAYPEHFTPPRPTPGDVSGNGGRSLGFQGVTGVLGVPGDPQGVPGEILRLPGGTWDSPGAFPRCPCAIF